MRKLALAAIASLSLGLAACGNDPADDQAPVTKGSAPYKVIDRVSTNGQIIIRIGEVDFNRITLSSIVDSCKRETKLAYLGHQYVSGSHESGFAEVRCGVAPDDAASH